MGKLTFRSCLESLKSRRVAVIGVGISNSPLIEALLAVGTDTMVCDARTREQLGDYAQRLEEMGAKLHLGDSYLNQLHTAQIIIRTPGFMPTHPALIAAVKRGAVLTSEMEIFFDVCPCMIIGVTGSDGKTTTATIIAQILRNQGKTVHLGGNIGTPLLRYADDMNADDIVVVELSSFQLITMKRSPDIAVITNITKNHLDVHTDMDEYIHAKHNIFRHQKPGNRLVLNFDSELTRRLARSALTDDVLFFSLQEKVNNGIYLDIDRLADTVASDAQPSVITDTRLGEICSLSDIRIPGAHNVENYMAAFAALRSHASTGAMRKTAREFGGVPHRLELIRTLNGVRYFNDSIASTPTRTIAGLKAFTLGQESTPPRKDINIPFSERKIILIAGGKDKGVSFDELGLEINKRVKKLVLTGAASKQIHDSVMFCPEHNEKLEVVQRDDFTEAVMEASRVAEQGDIVLLSPACTSFDRFKDFEERGNRFAEIVRNLR